MTRGSNRRLKVFQASLGFFESVVAVPSRPAALEAWGVRQNLFAEGMATIATDQAAVEAALAHPGEPLRRPIGSSDRFVLEPDGLPNVPHAIRRSTRPAVPRSTDAETSRRTPDRSALDRAEAALRAIDEARKADEADFSRRRQALDEAEARAQRAYVKARRAARDTLDAARRAFVRAGGAA